MKYVCALITVRDITRSRNFYEDFLRQKVKHDFGENVVYEGGFAIHLESHFSALIDNKRIITGGNNCELYFEDDDLESLMAELRIREIECVHEMREQPWRQRVVRFYDPDRHIIEVGESMQHLSYRLSLDGFVVEDIARIINMPFDFVQTSIEQRRNKI
jgi:hypothetical protein